METLDLSAYLKLFEDDDTESKGCFQATCSSCLGCGCGCCCGGPCPRPRPIVSVTLVLVVVKHFGFVTVRQQTYQMREQDRHARMAPVQSDCKWQSLMMAIEAACIRLWTNIAYDVSLPEI